MGIELGKRAGIRGRDRLALARTDAHKKPTCSCGLSAVTLLPDDRLLFFETSANDIDIELILLSIELKNCIN